MDLAYHIRMKFGTSHNEPSQNQLSAICREVASEYTQGRLTTLKDFGVIVKRHCPTAGTYGYKGIDNSDLNTLLALALKATQAGG